MTAAPELVAAAELFGLGQIIESPARVKQAYSNEVWNVRATSGEFAVKLFPAALSNARRQQLLSGIGFERLVLEQGLVPMPRPVAGVGSWLVELPTQSGPRLARCHEWVHGEPVLRPTALQVISTAGRYLGVLHAMKRPGGDTSQIPPTDRQRWYDAVFHARLAGMGWAAQLAALTPLLEELATDLDDLRAQRRPMQISHRDYDPKNAIINTREQLVLTDWDYAGPVLPGVELIVAATSFAETDDHVAAFVQAYRGAGATIEYADSLAMTAELADLDWLLRNVEASIHGDADAFSTAQSLITELPGEIATLRAWPKRLRELPMVQ